MSDPVEHDRAAARRSRRGGGPASPVPDRRYRPLFEQSPLGLVLYAPDGRLLAANRAIRQTLTRQRAASYNVLQDDYLAAAGVMGDIRRAFAGESVELAPLCYDPAHAPGAAAGRARWVRSFLYPIKDTAGSVREVVAVVEDVTDQVRTHQSCPAPGRQQERD